MSINKKLNFEDFGKGGDGMLNTGDFANSRIPQKPSSQYWDCIANQFVMAFMSGSVTRKVTLPDPF